MMHHMENDSIVTLNTLRCIKAHPHCKSPGQIGGTTWTSGLVEQLKRSGVDDKAIANEADQLRHLVRLNGGKRRRKATRLCSLRLCSLRAQFSLSTSPPPHTHLITRAGPSNLRCGFFVQHF